MQDYDEERALMGYVFRTHPEIVSSWECSPSTDRVRDELPPSMRDAYMEYIAERQRICDEYIDMLDKLPHPLPQITHDLHFPKLQPELSAAVSKVSEDLERQAFWKKFTPHKDHVSIPRCGRCQQILINHKTRQCLSCGYDWH